MRYKEGRFGRHHNEHRGMHGHGGLRGRRRLFDQGDLRLIVLALIAQGRSHGYELIKAIEEGTAGLYSPSPGVIYPTLTLLEEMALITPAESQGAKKMFALTDAGREELVANEAQVERLLARMASLGSGQSDNSPVFRAMQNLKMALKGRLTHQNVDRKTILAVAAMIDDVASRIERLEIDGDDA